MLMGRASATLAGGDGNDTLSDGLYGDILFGGSGHDPITGLSYEDPSFCAKQEPQISILKC
jgi:Ca2+-binding RTX toxin-like protein